MPGLLLPDVPAPHVDHNVHDEERYGHEEREHPQLAKQTHNDEELGRGEEAT